MKQRGYTLTVVLVLAAAMLAGNLDSGATGRTLFVDEAPDCVCWNPDDNSNSPEGATSANGNFECTELSSGNCEWV